MTCAGVNGQDRGAVVFDRLRATLDGVRAATPAVRDPKLFAVRAWTLTLPVALRHLALTPAGVRALRRATWELVQSYGAAGAVIIPHPVGDKDADCATFHPHVNVMWWASRPSRFLVDLPTLRRRWRGVLWSLANPRQRAGKRRPVELAEVELVPLPVVHVQAIASDRTGKLRHSCAYNARVFAGWSSWCPKWVQWFGSYVKADPPPAAPCECCGEHRRKLADGHEDVAARILHVGAHQETGPPVDLQGLDLPGDTCEWSFVQFSPALIGDVLGLPHHEVVARLDALAGPEVLA